MEMSVISVILPVYNRPKWSVEAVESVLSQTFTDFELIVIDDGSTEDIQGALKPYLDKIQYIYQSNGGVAKARNHGIKEAKGEYIAFIDCDDRWMPFKLELLHEAILRHPELALICTDFSAFREDEIVAKSYIKKYFSVFERLGLDFKDIFQNSEDISAFSPNSACESKKIYWGKAFPSLFQGGILIPSTAIIKKSILDEMGGFDETLPGVDDYKLSLLISIKYPIGYIDCPTAWYRLSMDQLSDQRSRLALQWEMNLSIIEQAIQDSQGIFPLDPSAIRNRKNYILKKLAIFSLKDGNLKRARECWKMILNENPWDYMAYAGWLMTLVPPPLISMGRKVKSLF
jgi:glycosyltransferase involved in cell wall biosynthesis